MDRVMPDPESLAEIRVRWDRKTKKYPFLLVRMSDGTTVRYNPEAEHPAFLKAMEGIRRMKNMTMKENEKR